MYSGVRLRTGDGWVLELGVISGEFPWDPGGGSRVRLMVAGDGGEAADVDDVDLKEMHGNIWRW